MWIHYKKFIHFAALVSVWRLRACGTRVPMQRSFVCFCCLLSVAGEELLRDVSNVVQRHSRCVDCLCLLRLSPTLMSFFDNAFTIELITQLDF